MYVKVLAESPRDLVYTTAKKIMRTNQLYLKVRKSRMQTFLYEPTWLQLWTEANRRAFEFELYRYKSSAQTTYHLLMFIDCTWDLFGGPL